MNSPTPRQQFAAALDAVLSEKDEEKHSMAVGFATGVCETLCCNGLIDEVAYTKYMGELLSTLQAQQVIKRVGHAR